MTKEYVIPKIIYLYAEGIKDLGFKGLKDFLKDNFGNIEVRLIRLRDKIVQTRGILFDFIATKRAFDSLAHARVKDACHIILTDKLLATLDDERRPHIRASIYSFPTVISTRGIVEGPAKPKAYYFYKQKYAQLGIWDIEEAKVKKKFRNRFIDYKDRRTNEVLKGYIAQGLFFYISGEPFCKNKDCRLFNAHWQEDLINSQIKSAKFCTRHKHDLEEVKEIAAFGK